MGAAWARHAVCESVLTVTCQSPSTTEVGSASQGHAFSRFPIDAGFFLLRVYKIAKSDCWLPLVRLPAWNNSAPTGRVFMKFDI
jgi:hypothetical protein